MKTISPSENGRTLTAAAWYNKKLPADLQSQPLQQVLRSSESYARGDYAAALAQGGALNPAGRDAVAAQLSRFTGISVAQVDRHVGQDQQRHEGNVAFPLEVASADVGPLRCEPVAAAVHDQEQRR